MLQDIMPPHDLSEKHPENKLSNSTQYFTGRRKEISLKICNMKDNWNMKVNDVNMGLD